MRRRATLALTAFLAAAGLVTGVLPSQAASTSDHLRRPLVGSDGAGFPGAEVALGDADRRGSVLAPLGGARSALARMGSGLNVSWTRYGTPQTLTRTGGFLATGYTGSNEQAARGFLTDHTGLFGLSAAQVNGLEPVSDTALSGGSPAHVVLLRQRFGGLALTEDGLVSVSLLKGQVAVVTGSLAPSAVLGRLNTATPRLGAADAVLAAVEDAGITTLTSSDLRVGKVDPNGFTRVTARGLHQTQLSRLRGNAQASSRH